MILHLLESDVFQDRKEPLRGQHIMSPRLGYSITLEIQYAGRGEVAASEEVSDGPGHPRRRMNSAAQRVNGSSINRGRDEGGQVSVR